MTKRQLIDEIRRFNVTAQAPFLEQFDEQALQQYLDHLQEAVNKRLRYAGVSPNKPGKFRMVS
jgi:ABC-type transporter MlaC component